MGKQGAELKWWDQSSSSTVLLDPAALVESCKQQIQGKDGIPAEHQRLIFACRVDNQEVLSYTCKRSSRCPRAEKCAASEFLEELHSWEAILKDDNHAIAKLLHPWVAAEEQVAVEDEKIASRLSCQTARELRSMGIPCNVYYLFFHECIPSSLKNGECCKSKLNIQIDKDFQARSFQILLFGRLNGSNLPLPFIYRMNGGEVVAQVSMQEQMAQYRQGQKTRHRQGLSTQSVGKGLEGRDVRAVVENNEPIIGYHRSEHVDDYYCPCGKDLEFTVIISKDRQLKCFVLTVIQVPANASKKPDQLASHVPGRCERGNSGSQHDSNAYRVSSAGATSHKCERTVCKSKIAFSESPATPSCQVAKTSSLPGKGIEPSASCSSSVPGSSEGLKSPTNNGDASPQQMKGGLTENDVEGLNIVEQPMAKLAKKKKRRKAKRNGRLTRENGTPVVSEHVDSLLAVSALSGSLDSSTWTAVLERDCELCDTTSCLALGADKIDASVKESPVLEENVRMLSKRDDKGKGGPGIVFCCERQCTKNGMGDGGSLKLDEAMKIGGCSSTKDFSYLDGFSELTSDQEVISLSKEASKERFDINTVLRQGKDDLPVVRNLPWSAYPSTGHCEVATEFRDPHALSANPDHTYMCTSTSFSQNRRISQPFVGPILVDMGLQHSVPPLRELVGNLETCSDAKEHLSFSDTNVSARGGYNSSGTGSRNGRNGADGSGSGSHGRGSEDRNGTSGYHGGGQGSSGSNHGSGPGGSSTSGSSGGSGGGNGNRGGGRGSSGGSWDSRRVDEDGGNGSKEGDNDERHRNSFKAGSNGEAAADSLQLKKAISLLDHRSTQGRKGVTGSVTGDQLVNGTSCSHGSMATASGSGKENINSWQRVQKSSSDDYMVDPDEMKEGSVAPSHYSTVGSDEGTAMTCTDLKVCPPSAHGNGFLHECSLTKESNVIEKREGVDHLGRGNLTQNSFVKVVKQSISNCSHDGGDDRLSSSNAHGSKDNQSSGAVPAQSSLKGAWQKKISWDVPEQSVYSKHESEAISRDRSPKGKLYVKPTKNGTQIRGQLPDTEIISQGRSLSAPSTPNGAQGNFSDSRELSNKNATRQMEGHISQSTIPGVAMGSGQVPQGKVQAVNVVAGKLPGEARSDEASQRLTAWKSRKSIGDQERPVVRDKTVGDRERMTHYQQKWVPVEHKTGGLVKGSGVQSKPSGTVPIGILADGKITESKESQGDFGTSEMMASSDGSTGADEVFSSSSPSKSLRHLQTFPSGNIYGMPRVPSSEAEGLEPREPVARVSTDQDCAHVEQANLRGLLPREKAMDNTQLASQTMVGEGFEPLTSLIPREQKHETLSDDKPSKGSHDVVRPVLSPAEEETRKVARAVLDAVQVSCRDRRAAERIVQEVGHPMAEFEKVLEAVAPSFVPDLDSNPFTSFPNEVDSPCVSGREGFIRSQEDPIFSQTCKGDDFSLCRCKVLDVPLNSIWQWYEEPSYYGVEVRAVDSQRMQKNGEEDKPFLAYFVPYLSALQLFGYSSEVDSRSSGALGGTGGTTDRAINSQPKVFSRNNVLATLFPTPGKTDEFSSLLNPVCSTSEQRDYTVGDRDNLGSMQFLYEFYDADLPQVRQPLFIKVKELSKGVSSFNSHSRGDPAVLDGLCLGHIHPASWFAVAWYPIYRIPEGPLRAVFLTYHSFSHFAPRSSLSSLMGGANCTDNSISLPVVGLACYNIQGEPWLSLGGRFSKEANKVNEGLSGNPSRCLEKRISSLQEVAAVMAKGIPDDKSASSASSADGSSSNKFKHSDYEFFVKRRR